MQILICPDGFKHSLSATQAAETIARCINDITPGHTLLVRPLTDGGEGFIESYAYAVKSRRKTLAVRGPSGKKVNAQYLLLQDKPTAIIEMAQASGLMLSPHNNPLTASSYGTGELIADALKHGAKKIIIGLGGSATTDAGAGMAQALGYQLLDKDNKPLPPGGIHLKDLHHINADNVHPDLFSTAFIAACDVTNPLTGPEGAAMVYGPQKGATADQARALDQSLSAFHYHISQQYNITLNNIPGSGAAGGMGAGIHFFLRGRMVSGFDLINNIMGLSALIHESDLIITGEGSLDRQSLNGKLVQQVCQLAGKAKKDVIAFAGKVGLDEKEQKDMGLKAAIPITPPDMPLDEAIAGASHLLSDAVSKHIARFIQSKR